MKTIKRVLCAFTAAVMCACLFGCDSGKKESSVENSEESSKEESVAEITEQETTETVTEPATEPPINKYTGSPYNIYSYYKEHCENIGKYIEYTKDTDPNKSLGTEGSYLKKLNFSLDNLPENTNIYPNLGVSIEIFEDNITAEKRKKEYTNVTTTLEYSVFVFENILLRITNEANSETVKALQNGLSEFIKNPVDYTPNQVSLQKEEVHPFSDPENYKAICKTVSYTDIARNNEGLKGQYFTFTGQIVQVLDGSYRMNITVDEYGFYSNTIIFTYNIGDGDRILENDIVTIWGQSLGLYTYTSVLGSDVTIPAIEARYISIENNDN